jgi:hypothetical protein
MPVRASDEAPRPVQPGASPNSYNADQSVTAQVNGTALVDASDANGGRERVVLTAAPGGIKPEPRNVRWLRSRLGAGPLSWVLRRGEPVVRVTRLGEDGYIEPPGEDEQNGPATVSRLLGGELSTRLAEHYEFVVRRKGPDGNPTYVEEWFPRSDCQRALETPDQCA